MANIVRFGGPLWDLQDYFIFDDFDYEQSDTFWLDTITDSGTVTIDDNANGTALLDPSDGTVGDNDEAYFGWQNETFLVAASRALYFRGRISFQEQNTDDANVVSGFANAANAANLIVDDGAGPRASGNLFMIEKRDGETEWRLTSRNGTAVTSTLSTTTAGVANDLTNWQVVEIFVMDAGDGVNVRVTAKVDGVQLRDVDNNPIRHTRLIASSTEMMPVFGVKNGGTNNELLYVDYCYASQTR